MKVEYCGRTRETVHSAQQRRVFFNVFNHSPIQQNKIIPLFWNRNKSVTALHYWCRALHNMWGVTWTRGLSLCSSWTLETLRKHEWGRKNSKGETAGGEKGTSSDAQERLWQLFPAVCIVLCHFQGLVVLVSALFTARQLTRCCWLTGNVVVVVVGGHVGLRPESVRCFWTPPVKNHFALDWIGTGSRANVYAAGDEY